MEMNYVSQVRLTCGSIVIAKTSNPVKIGSEVNYVWFTNEFKNPVIEIGEVTEIIWTEIIKKRLKKSAQKKENN